MYRVSYDKIPTNSCNPHTSNPLRSSNNIDSSWELVVWHSQISHTALGKPILFMALAVTQKMSNPLPLFVKHSCSTLHTHALPLADIDTTFTIIHTTFRTHAKSYDFFCQRLLIPSSKWNAKKMNATRTAYSVAESHQLAVGKTGENTKRIRNVRT